MENEETPRKTSLGRDAEREDPPAEFGAIRKDVAGPKADKRRLLPKEPAEGDPE